MEGGQWSKKAKKLSTQFVNDLYATSLFLFISALSPILKFFHQCRQFYFNNEYYIHHSKINILILSASTSSTCTTQAGPSSMTEFKLYTGMDFFIYGRNYCQNFRADLPTIGLKLGPNWTFHLINFRISDERPSLQLRPHLDKSNNSVHI